MTSTACTRSLGQQRTAAARDRQARIEALLEDAGRNPADAATTAVRITRSSAPAPRIVVRAA